MTLIPRRANVIAHQTALATSVEMPATNQMAFYDAVTIPFTVFETARFALSQKFVLTVQDSLYLDTLDVTNPGERLDTYFQMLRSIRQHSRRSGQTTMPIIDHKSMRVVHISGSGRISLSLTYAHRSNRWMFDVTWAADRAHRSGNDPADAALLYLAAGGGSADAEITVGRCLPPERRLFSFLPVHTSTRSVDHASLRPASFDPYSRGT